MVRKNCSKLQNMEIAKSIERNLEKHSLTAFTTRSTSQNYNILSSTDLLHVYTPEGPETVVITLENSSCIPNVVISRASSGYTERLK